jgi:tetratricopeptide (TPR) repeat protein
MEDVAIRILGRTSNEIGDQFEQLTKQLLGRLGFGSFIRNAYETGAEIDLRASHRVTNTPVLCECKAHVEPVNTRDVKNFHSQVEKERKADSRLVGLLFSTSGFVGTAEAWHRELAESDPEVAQYFQLKPGQAIIQMLIDAEMTFEPAAIRKMVRQRLLTYEQGHCWLAYSAYGLAWIVLLLVDGKPRFHTIVNAQGEPLPTWMCQEIAELCPQQLIGTRLLGLEVRRKVIVALLKQEEQTAEAIAEQAEESLGDASLALEKLVAEDVLCTVGEAETTFRFSRDLVPFVNLARELLEGRDVLTFIRSPYAQEMLRSKIVLSYIDQRYSLGMSADQMGILGRILSISPSSVREVLFSDPQMYRRARKQISEKIQDEHERSKWELDHASLLIRDTLSILVSDLRRRDLPLSSHLAGLGIKRCRLRVRLDMIGPIGRYLSVDATNIHAIETASESIKAGSLVSTSNPAAWHYWNGNFHLDVGEFELAHQEFDQAIHFCREGDVEPELHQAILSNKGVTFMRQEQWPEAVKWFDAALTLGEVYLPKILDNKALCLYEMGMSQEATEMLLEAERRFPQLLEDEFHQTTKRKICGVDS